uniref:SD22445p n=1 Tax=Drosophila melanogaster TaxID=7227 RepID=Q8MR92_DROME|nr:SD22445p [Drosophila melanogaster]
MLNPDHLMRYLILKIHLLKSQKLDFLQKNYKGFLLKYRLKLIDESKLLK